MLGIFTGTIVNVVLIILGTLAGILTKGERFKKVGDRIVQVFGLYVFTMGVEGAMGIKEPVLALASIVIGTIIGELFDIDHQFTRLGDFFKKKFAKPDDLKFSEGFVSASLLFCIGSMAIMGALQAGLENEHSIYYTKAILDGVTAITFAMGCGIGVAFSAIPVGIYQALLVLFASFLAPVLSPNIVTLSVQVGSLALMGIGLNLVGITKLKVANFMPAMFIPMIYQAISLLFAR